MGDYIVRFKETPKLKIADLKKQVPRWKIERISLKITTKVTEKEGKYYAGDILLANSKEKDADDCLAMVKGKKDALLLSGVLSEDDKGSQTLTLLRVQEPKK